MIDPESDAPGTADEAVGPVAAGPTAAVPAPPTLTTPRHHRVVWDPNGITYQIVALTPEQAARARTALMEEARSRWEHRNQATVRSKRLLTRLLTEDQRATLTVGYLEVTGASGRRYRIFTEMGTVNNIHWIDPRTRLTLGKFCVAPRDHPRLLPIYDSVLGQKLLIETDEKRFFRVAVYTPVRRRHPGGWWTQVRGFFQTMIDL